jgi:hypothetical protein
MLFRVWNRLGAAVSKRTVGSERFANSITRDGSKQKIKMKFTNKRRTKITVETHNVIIIRTRGKIFSVDCEQCKKNTEAVTVEQSAIRLNTTALNVYSLIRTGELHFLRIAESQMLPLVCGNSLGEDAG